MLPLVVPLILGSLVDVEETRAGYRGPRFLLSGSQNQPGRDPRGQLGAHASPGPHDSPCVGARLQRLDEDRLVKPWLKCFPYTQ